jgi:hypothetical protein
LARGAVAALESIELNKGGLHCVQCAVSLSQPFDGGHVTPINLRSKGKTAQYPLAVDMNRTSPALSLITSLFGSSEKGVLTNGIQQRGTRVEFKDSMFAIDLELNLVTVCHVASPIKPVKPSQRV